MAIYLARRVFSAPLQLIFQRARSVVAVSGSLAQRGIAKLIFMSSSLRDPPLQNDFYG